MQNFIRTILLSITASFALTWSAVAETPTLIKDLNTRPNQVVTSVNSIGTTSTKMLFAGRDSEHGTEVWVSDGTEAGTFFLKDLQPGTGSSSPQGFTSVSIAGTEFFFFSATTTASGRELWKSDGTEAGTVLIDINPGTLSSTPLVITPYDDAVLLTATTATHGRELWISNGAGTSEVIDLNPGVANAFSSFVANSQIVRVGASNIMVFPADNGVSGQEIFRTQGTAGTTALVGNLAAGSDSSYPLDFLSMPATGKVFFTSFDGINPLSLYYTDGLSVVLVKLLSLGTEFGPTDKAAISATKFVFTMDDPATGRELWVSDGTGVGTFPLTDVTPGIEPSFVDYSGQTHRLQPINNVAIFPIEQPFENPAPGIFATDGLANGTRVISDAFTNFVTTATVTATRNGRLYLSGRTDANGAELISTDGTAAGTQLEVDLNPGNLSSSPIGITLFKNDVHFFATTDTGSGLFKRTDNGTTLIKDLSLPGTQSSSPLLGSSDSHIIKDNKFYFTANHGLFGYELFVSDGTTAGTSLVKDINPGTNESFPSLFANINNGIVFSASTNNEGRELWFSDGTPDGTVLLKDIKAGRTSGLGNFTSLFEVNGKALFSANDETHGQELWTTDGTSSGTTLLKEINLGAGNGLNLFGGTFEMATFNQVLYFAASDTGSTSVENYELWRSDGSIAGTTKVKEINPSLTTSSSVSQLTAFPGKGIFLFSANDGTTGFELWKSDGTESNTSRVKDIHPTSSSYPAHIRALDTVALFSASTPNNLGQELFVTDGTEAGTQHLVDIFPGPNSSQIGALGVANNKYFFTATDGVNGRELWASDGSVAGTVMLMDVNPGAGNSGFGRVTVADGLAYISASYNDGTSRSKLIKSDGTIAGTSEVTLETFSNPTLNGSAYFRGQLLLSLSDVTIGNELYSILLDACPDDSTKKTVGLCGCGVAETDSDSDGTPDCLDACTADASKIALGFCGCGALETDDDGDGTPNCVDTCPIDPQKINPGSCGCANLDTDSNQNAIADCLANADLKAQLTQLRLLIKKLKVPKNKKQKREIKALKKQISAALRAFTKFRKANSKIIKLKRKKKLSSMAPKFERAVKQALRLKSTLNRDKATATAALKAFSKAL